MMMHKMYKNKLRLFSELDKNIIQAISKEVLQVNAI